MINFRFSILVALFTGGINFALAQDFEWGKTYGNSVQDDLNDIVVDEAGNTYAVGNYFYTVDFDPGDGTVEHTSIDQRDIFVQKIDAAGELVWVKSIGGMQTQTGNSIAIDESGDIVITGEFYNTVDFDPSPTEANLTSAGGGDIYVLKLDQDGNYLWAVSFPGSSFNFSRGITTDFDNNVYVTGYFSGTIDADPTAETFNLSSAGSEDAFLIKLNSMGELVWGKSFGGSGGDRGRAVHVDEDGSCYTTGTFSGSADLDPGPSATMLMSMGSTDIFIQKLTSDGAFVWANGVGGSGFDSPSDISTDNENTAIITGYYSETVDFDPGAGVATSTSVGGYDILLAKYDTDGAYLWHNTYGSSGDDRGMGLHVTLENDVYFTGQFYNTIDFDLSPGVEELSSAGQRDIFIEKLTDEGTLVWVNRLGSDSHDIGYAIAGKDDWIHLAGTFSTTVDFDWSDEVANKTSNGNQDNFLMRLTTEECEIVYGAVSANVCYGETYSLPGGAAVWEESGVYTDTLVSVAGCDSVVTVELTVEDQIETEISETACFSYLSPSGNYIWNESGVYSDTLEAANGCDSVLTVDLTIESVDASVTQSGITLSATEAGMVYQWVNCEDAFTEIDGATDQSFIPEENGNYAVIVSNGTCSDTSECLSVTTIGINENLMETIQIYPNPTQGDFKVVFTQNIPEGRMIITDVTGRVILEREIKDEPVINLNLPGAPQIYFVTLNFGDKVRTYKITKN